MNDGTASGIWCAGKKNNKIFEDLWIIKKQNKVNNNKKPQSQNGSWQGSCSSPKGKVKKPYSGLLCHWVKTACDQT